MNNSKLLIGLITVLAIGAGIYSTGFLDGADNTNLENPNQNLDPSTNEQEQSTTVQNNREIKGRNSSQTTAEANKSKTSIEASSKPVAKQNLRIVVYDKGERVKDENIYVNNREVGKTDDRGSLSLKVPETESITIRTEGNITETINVVESNDSALKGLKVNLSKRYEDRKSTLSLTKSGNSIKNASIFANQVKKGVTNNKGTITFRLPDKGQMNLVVWKENKRYEETFELQRPPIDLEWYSPVYDSDSATFNFDVELREEGQVTIDVGNKSAYTQQLSEGSNTVDKTFNFEEKGKRQYEIKIISANEEISKTGTVDIRNFPG